MEFVAQLEECQIVALVVASSNLVKLPVFPVGNTMPPHPAITQRGSPTVLSTCGEPLCYPYSSSDVSLLATLRNTTAVSADAILASLPNIVMACFSNRQSACESGMSVME